jgi:hypothetical protein
VSRPVGVGAVPSARPGASARLPSPLPNLLVVTQMGDAIPRSRYVPRLGDTPSVEGHRGDRIALRIPRLPARVPADQGVWGNNGGNPIEMLLFDFSVDPELGHGSSLKQDGSPLTPRVVSGSRRRAEPKLPVLDERDPSPADPGSSASAATAMRRTSSASPPSSTICATTSRELAVIPRDRSPRRHGLPNGARPARGSDAALRGR